MKTFEYLCPKDGEEVSKLLIKHRGKAKLIAGGTDLLVALFQKKLESPDYVISLKDVAGLRSIREEKGQGLIMGAMTTLREIERSDLIRAKYPVLSKSAGMIASIQIRNMATLAGNLCNAAPSADLAPPLICLDARVRLKGEKADRVMDLGRFFVGPGQSALNHGEWMMDVIIPPLEKGRKATYVKIERSAMDIAVVGVGVALTQENGENRSKNVRIVLGAVAPVPLRALRSEHLLEGKPLEPRLIEEAAEMASMDCKPITDVRASESYRREMIRVLTMRALKEVTKA